MESKNEIIFSSKILNKTSSKISFFVLLIIFKSGNLGSLRENMFEGDATPTVVRRFGTLLSLIPAYGRVGRLFPADACLSFYRYALRRL